MELWTEVSTSRAQYVLITLIRSPRLFNKGFRNPSVALVILTDDTVKARIVDFTGMRIAQNRRDCASSRAENRIIFGKQRRMSRGLETSAQLMSTLALI